MAFLLFARRFCFLHGVSADFIQFQCINVI